MPAKASLSRCKTTGASSVKETTIASTWKVLAAGSGVPVPGSKKRNTGKPAGPLNVNSACSPNCNVPKCTTSSPDLATGSGGVTETEKS